MLECLACRVPELGNTDTRTEPDQDTASSGRSETPANAMASSARIERRGKSLLTFIVAAGLRREGANSVRSLGSRSFAILWDVVPRSFLFGSAVQLSRDIRSGALWWRLLRVRFSSISPYSALPCTREARGA